MNGVIAADGSTELPLADAIDLAAMLTMTGRAVPVEKWVPGLAGDGGAVPAGLGPG